MGNKLRKLQLGINLVEVRKFYKKVQNYLSVWDQERFKGYIYIILTLFTVSFFGLVAIGPTLNTGANLHKQYSDNQVIYDSLQKKLTNLSALDSQYVAMQNDLSAIYTAIPK